MATKKQQTNIKKDNSRKNVATKQKEEIRVVPLKNYFIVFAIFVATIFCVFLLRYWYISYEEYQLTIPILKDKITEVTVNELDTFLAENLDPIVYIEVSEDENSREVAKDLIDVVKERNLTERVVYVNLSSVENKDAFFADFTAKYMDDKKLEYYPSLLIFSEGKVVAFVSRTEKQVLRISDVEQLFDEFELEGE